MHPGGHKAKALALVATLVLGGAGGCRRGPVAGGACKADVDCIADEHCASGKCRKRVVKMPEPVKVVPAPLPDTPPREPMRRAMDPRYQQSGARGAEDAKLMPAVPPRDRRPAPDHHRTFVPDG